MMQAASAAAAQQVMAEEESPQEAGGGGSSMLGRGVIGLTGALASKLCASWASGRQDRRAGA